jgi:hypothetical protein
MSCLSDLSGCELVAFISIFSIAFSKNLSAEEIALWSAFFSGVGGNLASIAIVKDEQTPEEDALI